MRPPALLLSCSLILSAQQTIFNVPSADIAGPHDWFYQHQTSARAWGRQRSWIQTNSFGYGAGHSLELDVSWFNLQPDQLADSSAAVGFKWSQALRADRGGFAPRLVVGDMMELRAPNPGPRRGPRNGNWFYAMLAAETPVTRTRVSAGFSDGTEILFGTREAGFMAGIEQPLRKGWSMQADWFSGRHELAYWIPGVVYRFRPRWMVSLGYQVPNPGAPGTRSVIVELTRN
jgi:hypothetical protein